MPGLALAGGVLVAALIALLLIGGDEPRRDGPLPNVTGPTATRILPGDTSGTSGTGGVAGENGGESGADGGAAGTQYGMAGGRGSVLGESARREGSGSAAETQYGTGGGRGTVLGGAPGPR
jgi:hypothetical protein